MGCYMTEMGFFAEGSEKTGTGTFEAFPEERFALFGNLKGNMAWELRCDNLRVTVTITAVTEGISEVDDEVRISNLEKYGQYALLV